jgi:hypothetical protein
MRKAILLPVVALAALLLTVASAQASTTTLTASPKTSVVGQKVTFTGKFTPSCAGTVQSSYFTIDGKRYLGTYSQVGNTGVGTYSISTLKAGVHAIKYLWSAGASCNGSASLSFTVNPKATPSPTPSPSPSPSTSAVPTPSPVLTSNQTGSDAPMGYIGGALILFVVLSGIVLAVSSRR